MTDETIICPSLKGTKINLERCLMKQREEAKFWGEKSKQMTGCPCQKTGENMSKIGTCENCERPGLTMSDTSNKCHQCNSYVAGTNKDPALREQRLQEAKELYKDLAPGAKLPFGVKKTLKAGSPSTMRVGPKVKKLDSPGRKVSQPETIKLREPAPAPAIESNHKLTTDVFQEYNAKRAATPSVLVPGITLPAGTNPARWWDPKGPLESIYLPFTAADQDLFDQITAAAQTHRRDPAQQILWMCEGFLHYQEEIRQMSLAEGAL
jgi:hypothetical protein